MKKNIIMETILTGAVAMLGVTGSAQQSATAEIRPFHVHFSDAALADLHRRVLATNWPDRELVGDLTQGLQLGTMKKLAHYWVTEYNWRKIETTLNALPQFITNIDGVDIHFIHVRSKHPNALPIIITHGGLGSDPVRIARAWIVLMKRLGYTRYVAQGGDWGDAVTEQMAVIAPPELLGIHTNMAATLPPEVSKALATGGPTPEGL